MEEPFAVIFRFDKNNSLATTYNTQGMEVGLAAGLQTHQIEVMVSAKKKEAWQ